MSLLLTLLLPAAAAHIPSTRVPTPCAAVDTAGMIACDNSEFAVWDRRLNIAYREALQRVGPASREKLRQAQRLWVQYRDANCDVYEQHGGTIHFLLGGSCMIRMTKERATELRGFDEAYD